MAVPPRPEWQVDGERYATQLQAQLIGKPPNNTIALTHDEIFRMKDPK